MKGELENRELNIGQNKVNSTLGGVVEELALEIYDARTNFCFPGTMRAGIQSYRVFKLSVLQLRLLLKQ